MIESVSRNNTVATADPNAHSDFAKASRYIISARMSTDGPGLVPKRTNRKSKALSANTIRTTAALSVEVRNWGKMTFQ